MAYFAEVLDIWLCLGSTKRGVNHSNKSRTPYLKKIKNIQNKFQKNHVRIFFRVNNSSPRSTKYMALHKIKRTTWFTKSWSYGRCRDKSFNTKTKTKNIYPFWKKYLFLIGLSIHPSKQTTLFQRCNNVADVRTTLYRRQINVVWYLNSTLCFSGLGLEWLC